jgi:Mg-chelatase subunit ChlD
MLLLPTYALAQTTEIEIVDVNTASFEASGATAMTVELRNLQTDLDPSLISVTADGEPVANLTGQLLTETTVAQGVVLVIDSSGSMQGAPIEAAKTAAKSFVDQKRPEDFIAIVTFSDEVTVLSEFSNRATVLNERIDTIEAAGGTAMFDGIIRGTELFATADDDQIRKNMIVLTEARPPQRSPTAASARSV